MDEQTPLKINTALDYLKRGWSVFPVRPDKKPYVLSWKIYQERYATEDEVRDWFNKLPDAGIAIVTGKISNLVVLDIDPGSDENSLAKYEINSRVSVKTPRGGKHIYFKHPGIDIKTRTDLYGNNSHIDIRADGGYVVAPPSKSEDGKFYEWIKEPDTNSYFTQLSNDLIETINNKPKENFVKVQSTFTGVSEGSRNNRAAEITGSLIKKTASSKWLTECWPKLVIWNEQNIPPLPIKELRSTFQSICSRELISIGSSNKEINNAVKLDDAISFIDLLNKDFPFPAWTVQGLFEAHTTNMISAAPNHYKSWVVDHIAICVASGRSVFDHFPVTKQNVMIVNEEDTQRSLKERSLALIENIEDLPIYFHIGKGLSIDDLFIKKIIPQIKEKNIGFLILDSLRSLHRADENQSQQMQEIMDQLKKISREGVTILFTHHHKKANNFLIKKEMSGSEDFRGSTSINAAVHGHISCEPKKDEEKEYLLIVQHKLKCDEKMGPFRVLIQKDKQSKKIKFIYEGEFNETTQARTRAMDEILSELQFTNWATVNDLIDKNIAGERIVRDALRFLVSQKKIITKTRKELLADKVSIPEGKSTEKFYSLLIKKERYEEDYGF